MTDWNIEMEKVRALRANRTKLGHGSTPAVVVVDFQRAFTEHEHIGPTAVPALENTAVLLDAARAAGVPIVYLVMILDSLDDRMLAQRERSTLTARCLRGDPWTELNPIVASKPGDYIVEKTVASGFFRTELDTLLRSLGVDEIIMTGTSTSGCVRATVVDAAYLNYRISVVEECCDDFRIVSSEASLWDMQDRFGDVDSLSDTLERLTELADLRAVGAE